jgi:hypothetical protein
MSTRLIRDPQVHKHVPINTSKSPVKVGRTVNVLTKEQHANLKTRISKGPLFRREGGRLVPNK